MELGTKLWLCMFIFSWSILTSPCTGLILFSTNISIKKGFYIGLSVSFVFSLIIGYNFIHMIGQGQ